MSGTRPKGLLGPERPQYQPTHNSRQVTQPDAGDTTSPPPLTGSPLLEGRVPKLLMLVSSIIVGIMFILAFSFCLAGGIKHKEPRYFLLLINILLSTGVTGLLIFWYYRRVLQPALLWYVFLQCLFLFFQCVTTDIFAWYEQPDTREPIVTSWTTLYNSTQNGSNGSNGTTTHATLKWTIS